MAWVFIQPAIENKQVIGQAWFGAVANDRTMPVLQGYMNAKNKDLYAPVALDEIQADKLTDQYVFKNDLALSFLKLKEIIEL